MTRAQLDELLRNEPADPSPLDALDNREMEVLSLLSQGSNSSFIAREMLIAMAAEQLQVEPKDLRIVDARFLNHDKSKTLTLAEVAKGSPRPELPRVQPYRPAQTGSPFPAYCADK